MTNQINRIGVIGAGVMGVGVAQSAAQAGYQVTVIDVSQEILDKAKQILYTNLRFHGLVSKKAQSDETPEQVLERVHFSTSYEGLHNVDFVVENVTENWDIKKSVYVELERNCPSHAVYAVNTSAISITRVAALTNRQEQVLGMHFMNPVPLKDTVESIRAFHTSQDTIEQAARFLAKMGKRQIVVNDMPGFVSNRVLMLTINEAVELLRDGVATAQDIDDIFTSCFGHPMGPLATADLIGLDTILFSIEVLYDSYADSKFRPSPLLKKLVDAGRLGKKSGHGFFKYAGNI